MRKIALAAIGFALFTAVANTSIASAHEAPQPTNINSSPTVVTVQKGDTLSRIAQKHDTTYKRLFNANDFIVDPNRISPGQKIRIPGNDERLPDRALPSGSPKQTKAVTRKNSAATTRVKVTSDAPTSVTIEDENGVWDKIAACESNGNWSINTGNGYYGGLQFTIGSWKAAGGDGMPHEASREEQITRGKVLQSKQGWKAWPACSKKAGLL